MYNPNDLSGFISPFNVELAVNARNKADAYTKSKDALRSGSMAAFGADSYGKAVGQKFIDEANAKVGNIAGRANMFGNIMGGIGTLGSIGVMGGFSNPSLKGPSYGTYDGAFQDGFTIGGMTPTESFFADIPYSPFGS